MTPKRIVALKAAVWLVCLWPLIGIGIDGYRGNLTANPIEYILNKLGYVTLVLLLVSLSVTPLRRITGLHWLIRFRRLLGLFAFFYVCLHFAVYFVLDQEYDVMAVLKDIPKRPFITVGFAAFVLLIPLAMTSTAWSIRKLGGKNWNRLHRLVYVSASLGVVHYFWKVKADLREPGVFAGVLAVLLGYRLVVAAMGRIRKQRAAASRP